MFILINGGQKKGYNVSELFPKYREKKNRKILQIFIKILLQKRKGDENLVHEEDT